ncbi:MAG TPA: VCBS repeat-containing protein [Polyangiaceae bacterium]|nr:VCBS repeat-containing protein [Polyangiaceae bacterium]
MKTLSFRVRQRLQSSRVSSLALCLVVGGVACSNLIGADFDQAHRAPKNPSGGSSAQNSDATGARMFGSGGASSGAGGRSPRGGAAAGGTSEKSRPTAGGQAGASSGSDSSGGTVTVPEGGSGGDPTTCPNALEWKEVSETSIPTMGEEAHARSLMPGVGVASGKSYSGCIGAQISSDLLLFLDCNVIEGDTVTLNEGDASELRSVPYKITYMETTVSGRFRMNAIRPGVPHQVPWSARAPMRGERVTVIGLTEDHKFAKRFAVTTLEQSSLEAAAPCRGDCSSAQDDAAVLVFGSDDHLIAYCQTDPCEGLRHCVTTAELRAQWTTFSMLAAMQPLLWGDVSGDGRADAIAVQRFNLEVRTSLGSDWAEPTKWYDWERDQDYPGKEQVALGDITGDGMDDFVAVGPGLQYLPSLGDRFGSPVILDNKLTRAEAVRLGDVDGDGYDDVVLLQADTLTLMTQVATTQPVVRQYDARVESGWLSFDLADVDGDSHSDALLAYTDRIEVLLGSSKGLAANHTWLNDLQLQPPGVLFADVTGDGRPDAVRIDSGGMSAFPSVGDRFDPLARSLKGLRMGQRGNAFADLDGEGHTDAVVQDTSNMWIFLSSSKNFGSADDWLNIPWLGSRF